MPWSSSMYYVDGNDVACWHGLGLRHIFHFDEFCTGTFLLYELNTTKKVIHKISLDLKLKRLCDKDKLKYETVTCYTKHDVALLTAYRCNLDSSVLHFLEKI